ncbi:hypothetical protein ACJMK2_040817 [Sinanodonta woodiana]|uniref:Ig-like domain-containing protein n=1 Tax=Sinanodonta woodiana TaxID=1069815 RepID=A0ABD3W2S7_SINWO
MDFLSEIISISKDSITEIVAYNNQTVNYTKYEVTGTYKLSIFHTNLEDEALYECQTDGKKANAALSVSVPMDSMTITWNAQTPLNYDSEVELICRSYHSRPPAELSWYWGNHDFSRDAHYCYKLYNADGFGDSVSVLRVSMMNHRNSEIPFRCVASLPANDRVRTEYAFLPITSISDATIERISSLQFIIYNIIFFTTLDIVT